jgi:hypothetical protein
LRADATYQRIGADRTSTTIISAAGVTGPIGLAAGKFSIAANRWHVPVTAEREVTRHLRLGVGPEISIVTGNGNIIAVRSTFGDHNVYSGNPYFGYLDRTAIFGMGASAEFPFRAGPLVCAPQFRYTRWTSRHYTPWWSMDEFSIGAAFRFRL